MKTTFISNLNISLIIQFHTSIFQINQKKVHDPNDQNKNDEMRVQRIDEESIWGDQEIVETREQ